MSHVVPKLSIHFKISEFDIINIYMEKKDDYHQFAIYLHYLIS